MDTSSFPEAMQILENCTLNQHGTPFFIGVQLKAMLRATEPDTCSHDTSMCILHVLEWMVARGASGRRWKDGGGGWMV